MQRLLWGSVLSLILLGVDGQAAAQDAQPDTPQIQEARERFDRATQEYEDGHYALALADFEAVYRSLTEAGHRSAPIVLFNVARCYVRLGRAEDAIRTYERFLADAPEGAPNIEVARTEVRDLRARIALRGGAQTPTTGGGISPVGPIVAGIGAAAMIAGAITGGLAIAAHDDATRGCTSDGHCPAELSSTADQAQLLANATDGLLFGGLAVAAAGVLLVFVLPSDGEAPSASAGCSMTGCGAVVRGRF